MSLSMPAERSPGFEAGLELYDLAAPNGIANGLVERRLRAIDVMLATDPKRVFDCVPLPATGASGLALSIVIRDDFRRHLAFAADDFDLSHNQPPWR